MSSVCVCVWDSRRAASLIGWHSPAQQVEQPQGQSTLAWKGSEERQPVVGSRYGITFFRRWRVVNMAGHPTPWGVEQVSVWGKETTDDDWKEETHFLTAWHLNSVASQQRCWENLLDETNQNVRQNQLGVEQKSFPFIFSSTFIGSIYKNYRLGLIKTCPHRNILTVAPLCCESKCVSSALSS